MPLVSVNGIKAYSLIPPPHRIRDWDNYNPEAGEEEIETSTETLSLSSTVTNGKPEQDVDRHEFEAKLRKEIGHEYRIGFGRFVTTLVIVKYS
ncbi:hypothetical protein GCK32_020329 [Trichostrongylus colubriformis]|uniref:Uncharacterized protein n=1 Tax=Trichostrongylus colubriformis TaxID=6319 RepID=A0AAN8IPD9_TRICO